MIGYGYGCVNLNRLYYTPGRNSTEVSVVNRTIYHFYDPGLSPRAASVHEEHSGIQAEKNISIIQLQLVAAYSSCSMTFEFTIEGKGHLEQFPLSSESSALEIMQPVYAVHWPELACYQPAEKWLECLTRWCPQKQGRIDCDEHLGICYKNHYFMYFLTFLVMLKYHS